LAARAPANVQDIQGLLALNPLQQRGKTKRPHPATGSALRAIYMKLSIVILCWNDRDVIGGCLRSIYCGTHFAEFEVIVSVNGSDDGSVEFIRQEFPAVRVIENGGNLGFAKGNNVGILASKGELILILNPDTIIHDRALDRLVEFADRHPEAGAFGCRVLNPDGSYQVSARPFPSVRGYWLAALYLRPLAYISDALLSDTYAGWNGDTQREVDWQSGCCVMFRSNLLKQLAGFDEQFFYHFEEVDLCRRARNSGFPLLFTPAVTITHLGGQRRWSPGDQVRNQSVSRFRLGLEIEAYRNRYRFFYKHYGAGGAWRCRQVSIASIRLRQLGYGLLKLFRPTEGVRLKLELYRAVVRWNKELDPIRFMESGEEPTACETISGSRIDTPSNTVSQQENL
jgi:GT2 family glycosyltransferase